MKLVHSKSYQRLRTVLRCVQVTSTFCIIRGAWVAIPRFPIIAGIVVTGGFLYDTYSYYFNNEKNVAFNFKATWFCVGLLSTGATLCAPNRTLGAITWTALVRPIGSAGVGEASDVVSTMLCLSSALLAQLPPAFSFPFLAVAYSINTSYSLINFMSADASLAGKIANFGTNFMATVSMPINMFFTLERIQPYVKPCKEKIVSFAEKFKTNQEPKVEEIEMQSMVAG